MIQLCQLKPAAFTGLLMQMDLPNIVPKVIIPATYSFSEADLSPKNRCPIPNECPGAPRRQPIRSFNNDDAVSRSKRKISCLHDSAAEAFFRNERAPDQMHLTADGGTAMPDIASDGSPIKNVTDLLLGLQQPVPQVAYPVEVSGPFTKITDHTFVHQGMLVLPSLSNCFGGHHRMPTILCYAMPM